MKTNYHIWEMVFDRYCAHKTLQQHFSYHQIRTIFVEEMYSSTELKVMNKAF